MTKDQKKQKLLECKAIAYDSISRLRRTIDSHRNFHRLVLNIMAGVSQFAKQLREAPTSPCEQFQCQCEDPNCPCCKGDCQRDATCQVNRIDMDDICGTLMCDECANDALASGVFSIVEESCPEIGQD